MLLSPDWVIAFTRLFLVLAAVAVVGACDLSPTIHEIQVDFATDQAEYHPGDEAVLRLANRGRWTIATTECVPLQVRVEDGEWIFAHPFILIGDCETWRPFLFSLRIEVGDEVQRSFLIDDRFRSERQYRAVVPVRHGWDEANVESEAFMVVGPSHGGG